MLRGAAMNGPASHSRTVYIRFERIKEMKEGRGGQQQQQQRIPLLPFYNLLERKLAEGEESFLLRL